MCNRTAQLLGVLAVSATGLMAQSIEYLPLNYFVSDLSYDGTIAVGNLIGPFEPFIWTLGDGVELIGGATVPTIGVGAGTPDISHDGLRASATILDETQTLATMGIWTRGLGWDSVIELTDPGVTNVDSNIASAWGLSGDGTTISGFYYSSAAGVFGRAQPCTWSEATGLVPLDVDAGRNSRVNALNYDGTIGAGWEERPDGAWQPTVWRDGVKMRLSPSEYFTTCEAIDSSGDTVVGNSFKPSTANRVATIWRWDGANYIEQKIDLLPGTPAINGWALANGVSDGGSVVVGSNFYSFSPGGTADGFIWTEQTGVMNAEDYFADQGFEIPDTIEIRGISTVSPDGSTFVAEYLDTRNLQFGSMILRLPQTCAADLNGDGNLDFFDVSLFLSGYSSGDLGVDFDNNGTLDFFDVSAFLSAYNQGCPV